IGAALHAEQLIDEAAGHQPRLSRYRSSCFLCRMEIKCGAPISMLLKLYHSGVQFSIFFMLLHAKIFPAALQNTKEWCKLKI
ncbi:hypothetical protein, partial [uncultured Acetatifactor sp.]|uniref:hypothetical protein n=1 Tax=uncultured Acetatifactor sp. TaxID=1671927 RepID=UPI00260CA97F